MFAPGSFAEAVYRQTAEEFIRCLENAFHHFGGVPKMLVVDNLKAAVLKADWYDPELNPKIQAFAEHYGTVILPTKPNTPRHKGKIERQVGYVQDNGLKGKRFASLVEQNTYLLEWEHRVADTSIHGTTKKQISKVFEEIERPALLPLPLGRFPFFHEAQRVVSRDAHVEVDKAFYSVPPRYLGRMVTGDPALVLWAASGQFENAFQSCVEWEGGRYLTDQRTARCERTKAVTYR